MAFVDVLGFEIATLVIAAALFTYVAVVGYFALRRNDAHGLRSVLRGSAVPIGGVGIIATGLGFWGELAWPLPGAYNILFSDVYLIFGVLLVAFALSAALTLKLQYVGVLGLVSGGVAMFYGFSAYQLNMTKEPLEMLLLYSGFGMAGVLALPATLVVDQYLHHPDGAPAFWQLPAFGRGRSLGIRAAQPMARVSEGATGAFVLPRYATLLVLAFPLIMALAGIAAIFFLGSTIPSHLKSAP
jgi:putative membrane protein